MTDQTETVNLRVYPPLASVIAPAVALLLEWLMPLGVLPPLFSGWALAVGVALMALSFVLAAAGARAFKAASTNIDPHKPALVLVETGPYRFTRNPMYLGMVVLQAGLALTFSLDWGLVIAPVLWAALHFGTVLPEEAYLSARFGQPYRDYLARSRRWV